MDRRKKLQLNTLLGLLSQVTTFICGFIIPKLILEYYGSDVNGLVSSITYFLSFISLAECGIGVVVQSSLYKPLADHNEEEISRIITSSDRFFKKIGIVLVAYVGILFAFYPLLVNGTYDFWFTSSLVLVISISTFIEYYICLSYRVLVTADQSVYVLLALQIITQILITVFSVFLVNLGASILIFKLSASIILFIRPLVLSLYVKKHYKINKRIELTEVPIKQKWNGVAQHVAYVVLTNTDTVVLTFFSTLSNVSIYNVYFLVVNGIKMVISSSITGIQSLLGNMYAKQESDVLLNTFALYEWIMHTGVTFLFTCTSILIVPFVKVYTLGIEDANYIVPLFGMLISFAQMAYCIRLPYNAMVFVAGHYKQTQNSAIIEAFINVIISIACVFNFGLVGVAIGTLIAMIYRTVYLAIYLSNNIINRPFKHFVKHIAIDVCVILISFVATRFLEMQEISYIYWAILAIKVALITGVISIICNCIMYPNMVIKIFRKLK